MSVTPTGRVSFPSVFKPSRPNPDSEPKFSLTLLFKKDDPGLKLLQDEVEKFVASKYGKSIPKKLRLPFLDGDDEDKPEYAGHMFIRFGSKADRPPFVVDQDKRPIDPFSNAFYSGCYARVSYSLYAWDHQTGGKGISFGLKNVQKVADGEPLDGRTTADDDFDTVCDEIPF